MKPTPVSPSESRPRLSEDFALWDEIQQLLTWCDDVAALGSPRFGQMACRVRQLTQCLRCHFDEAEANIPTGDSMKWREDHSDVLRQIEEFAERLDRENCPYDTWQAARRALEEILDDVELHEPEGPTQRQLPPR